MRKRLLTTICALASLLWSFKASAEVVEYTCGATENDNVTATLDTETGVITVSGTGAMTDFRSVNQRPWYANISYMSTCMVAEGVTSVGANAFSSCDKMKSALLASTVSKIGAYAFKGCIELNIVIYEGENELIVGSNAFNNVNENAVLYVKEGKITHYSDVTDIEVKEITLALNITEATIGYEETIILTPTYTLADFVGNVNYTWTSSDPMVATVENGLVRPVNPGTADIKVSVITPSGNTVEAVCMVEVVDAATGIDVVNADLGSNAIYDIMGRKVNNPTKGVYIRNGKKCFVK